MPSFITSLPATQVWVTCSRPACRPDVRPGRSRAAAAIRRAARRTGRRLAGKQRSDLLDPAPARWRRPSVAAFSADGRPVGFGVHAGGPWPAGRHGAFHETCRGDCSRRHRRCPGRNSGRAPGCGHGRDAAGELQVGGRAVRNVAAFMRPAGRFLPARDVRHARRSAAARAGPAAQPLDRAYAVLFQAFLDFVRRFVHVHVDRYFQLGGQGGDFFEGLVGHGVGCVWRKAEAEQRRRLPSGRAPRGPWPGSRRHRRHSGWGTRWRSCPSAARMPLCARHRRRPPERNTCR
jgi:hypothetical protein